MADVEWICLSVSEFAQGTVQLRGRSKRPKPSVFSQDVGAADVPQISSGAFILVPFDVFFFFVFFSLDVTVLPGMRRTSHRHQSELNRAKTLQTT